MGAALGAGQNVHEVLHSRQEVPRVATALAQRVIQVLLDERPLSPMVHAEHLPAGGQGGQQAAADQAPIRNAECMLSTCLQGPQDMGRRLLADTQSLLKDEVCLGLKAEG